MGRISLKKQKSSVQICREKAGLTRREASERMGFVSENRLEKIETGKTQIHPTEVLAMQEAYGDTLLVNRFCTSQCAIGKRTIAVLQLRPAESIVLETLACSQQLETLMKTLVQKAASPDFPDNCSGQLEHMAEVLQTLGRCGQEMSLFLQAKEKKK